jgi:fibronectin-binding autotransporter adhesin
LAANPTDCSANQFANAIAANGNLACASITDADVSDTLTASIFVGSGSSSNAVDLATAEVAGNLRATNLQSAAADLGAANVTVDLSNTNGSFVTNFTVDGTITAATFVGALSGNATTASALAANPNDCAANQFATTIAANGDLTCAAITDADVPNNITIDLATTATVLQKAGAITITTTATAGADDIVFSTASTEVWRILENGNLQSTASRTIDLNNASATTLTLTNSGSGVLGISVEGGATFGAALTVSAGGASITGGLNNNSGGITNAGAVSGATTVTASSTINTTGGAVQTNSTDRIENDGDLVNIGNITAAGGDFNVNSFGDITSTFTALDGSNTTNGAAVVPSTSMVLNSATNFDVGNYIRLSSTDCSGTEDICYAKITGKVTNTLTITPALVWGNGSAVTEYHVPEIGGTNTADTLANRYGRGYFISGVVTGNGTTYYEENGITSSLTSFSLLNSTVTTLNIGGAATTINLGVSGGTVNVAGGLSVSQAISGVGVNAGTGLLQGTGGLTVTGTANINATGTAATNIGNATGTLAITGSASSTIVLGATTLSAAEINLLDTHNVALVDIDDAVNTAITGTGVLGAGSISTGFGAIDVGTDTITTTGTIGTAGTTTFTGAGATFSGTLAANGASGITSSQATLSINAGGTVNVQDALTVDSITVDTGGVSIAAGQSYTGAGAVTLSSATGTNLTLDSGTTGSIGIGTDASAESILIGSGNAIKTIQIGLGTAGNTIQIGTNNTTADTISVGSALDTLTFTGNAS